MLPQGPQLVNLDYFKSLSNQVNAAASCEDLQALTTDAFASITASIKSIEDQVALLAPMLNLLTPPSASPSAIVTWINSFIAAFITPLVKPSATYAAQLTGLVAQMSSIESAIAAKAASFEFCAVTVPPLMPPPVVTP